MVVWMLARLLRRSARLRRLPRETESTVWTPSSSLMKLMQRLRWATIQCEQSGIIRWKLEREISSYFRFELITYPIFLQIDLIKEIMCNHSINGRSIDSSIRFIAAVNPYRRHSLVNILFHQLGYMFLEIVKFETFWTSYYTGDDKPAEEGRFRVQNLRYNGQDREYSSEGSRLQSAPTATQSETLNLGLWYHGHQDRSGV